MKNIKIFLAGLAITSLFPLCGCIGYHCFGPEGIWLALMPIIIPSIIAFIYGIGLIAIGEE